MPMTSDQRFEELIQRAKARTTAKKTPTAPAIRPLRTPDGAVLGDIRRNRKGVTMTITDKDQDSSGFARWLDAQAETLIAELHDRWSASRSEGED